MSPDDLQIMKQTRALRKSKTQPALNSNGRVVFKSVDAGKETYQVKENVVIIERRVIK